MCKFLRICRIWGRPPGRTGEPEASPPGRAAQGTEAQTFASLLSLPGLLDPPQTSQAAEPGQRGAKRKADGAGLGTVLAGQTPLAGQCGDHFG